MMTMMLTDSRQGIWEASLVPSPDTNSPEQSPWLALLPYLSGVSRVLNLMLNEKLQNKCSFMGVFLTRPFLPQFSIFSVLISWFLPAIDFAWRSLIAVFHNQLLVANLSKYLMFFPSINKGLKLFHWVQSSVLVFGRVLNDLKKARSLPSRSR